MITRLYVHVEVASSQRQHASELRAGRMYHGACFYIELITVLN